MYLDNNTAYKKHVTTLKHKNNLRLINGDIIKNGDNFDCVTCKNSISQYSVEQRFKTKTHLDNVGGITKDLRSSFTDKITKTVQVIVIYVTLDKTIKRNTSNQNNIMKILKQKNLLKKSGEIELMS